MHAHIVYKAVLIRKSKKGYYIFITKTFVFLNFSSNRRQSSRHSLVLLSCICSSEGNGSEFPLFFFSIKITDQCFFFLTQFLSSIIASTPPAKQNVILLARIYGWKELLCHYLCP